jgi:hypothetical protein
MKLNRLSLSKYNYSRHMIDISIPKGEIGKKKRVTGP